MSGTGVKRAARAQGTILLIGAGRMGGALLSGWLSKTDFAVAVVEPNPSADLRKLAKDKRVTLHNNVSDAPRAKACVIAVKPQILKTNAKDFAAIAQSGALMISIAAGTRIAPLCKAFGKDALIVRAMPNLPGSIGAGISALYAGAEIKPAMRKLAQSLLAALGETVWVKAEKDMDIVTAVSGSGPAYVFLLVEALTNAAIAEGLPRAVAEKLARQTIIGSGALLAGDGRSAADLRKAVTSPGGTTEAALRVLMAKPGLDGLMKRGVSAARKRGTALGK